MPDTHIYSKILVVDDEQEALTALKEFLCDEQFVVETARDGENALSKVEEFHPHCILMDVRMPYLNGVDALKMVKVRQPEAEVIMVTAVANIKMAEECMRNGAFGYITKPVDLDHLLKEIHSALEHRKNEVAKKRKEAQVKAQAEELKSLSSLLNEELFHALKFPVELLGYSLPEFSCHNRNVSWVGRKIAEHMNLSHIRLVELGGLYHDIGKLCLPSQLKKKGSKEWTPEEKKIYEKYPEYGSDMVQSHFHLKGLASIIYCQCENVNGSGFPNRLKGDQIPIEAKIISVANAYVELKSRLVPGNIRFNFDTDQEILSSLKAHSGIRYDEKILNALEGVIKNIISQPIECEKPISGLQEGMVLSRDLLSDSGKLIFPCETCLNKVEIQRIHDLHAVKTHMFISQKLPDLSGMIV
jgi:response regulator RpfG family c-di-GMP phosphodiesterase